MGGRAGESGGRRRIDGGTKSRFLAAVRKGARLEEAARAAGCSLPGLYGARARDAVFKAAWAEALEFSAAEERIVPNNRRRVQRRRMRQVKFDEARQEAFLAHFAGTCDAREAAGVAGVDHSTVYKRCARDADFAARFQEALQQGYVRLEAEALRQRLEVQQRLRDGLVPTGEIAAEFERVMKLLARWDRRDGRVGRRSIAPGHRQAMTFDDAIKALHKRLQALDIPIKRLPPPGGEKKE